MMKTKLLLPILLIIANSIIFESCLWASPKNNDNSKHKTLGVAAKTTSASGATTPDTIISSSSSTPSKIGISQDSNTPKASSKDSKSLVDLPIITGDSLLKLLDSIAWNETTHTFEGGVPTGPPATFKFVFTNYSNHPIKVKGVDAACSCTATDFTRNEIPPGSSGWIQAAYKTENTFGYFKKYVDVFFEGSPNKHRLYLTGSVDPYKK
jgi:hypothetical protein